MHRHFTFIVGLLTLASLGSTRICYAGAGIISSGPKMAAIGSAPAMVRDTVPEVRSVPAAMADSSVPAQQVIKEVPKAKKQLAPLAVPVTVKVKPINIIKPKIIKPVIKIR